MWHYTRLFLVIELTEGTFHQTSFFFFRCLEDILLFAIINLHLHYPYYQIHIILYSCQCRCMGRRKQDTWRRLYCTLYSTHVCTNSLLVCKNLIRGSVQLLLFPNFLPIHVLFWPLHYYALVLHALGTHVLL